MVYISDATLGSSPCAGSGTGALAVRIAGTWNCTLGATSLSIAANKHLYVDGTRTDSYTQTGSITNPYKTIMGAVNQVVTNGDNGTYTYIIDVAPAVYAETVDLGNAALVQLIFAGHGEGGAAGATFGGYGTATQGATIEPGSGNALQANNDNLKMLQVDGFQILGPVSLADTTNPGNMGNGGFVFVNDYLSGSSFTASNILNLGLLYSSLAESSFSLTNIQSVLWVSTDMTATNMTLAQNSGAAPSGWSGTLVFGFNSRVLSMTNLTLTGQITLALETGPFGGGSTNITLASGQQMLLENQADCLCNLTVSSGASFTSRGGAILGTFTNSGTYAPQGATYANSLFLGQQCKVLTGSGAPAVAAAVCSLYLRTDGGATSTLYVKESGTGSSGWVAK
jgi:hypothetical protein